MKKFKFNGIDIVLYWLGYKQHEDKDLNYINFFCEENNNFYLDIHTWSTKFSGYNTLNIHSLNELNSLAKFLSSPTHSRLIFSSDGNYTLENEIKVLTLC